MVSKPALSARNDGNGTVPLDSTGDGSLRPLWDVTEPEALFASGSEAIIVAAVERLAGYETVPYRSRGYRLVKRALDISVATVGLVLLTPLFMIVALLIRLDSPGRAFFVQPRVGYRGVLFPMLKFRTMFDGAEPVSDGPHKLADDPRVTRIGRFLRAASIDELPQLVNVLRGEMTLVGPRPELPEIVLKRYEPWQYRRLLVPQGLTGWWQVTGRGAKLLCEHTEDDLYYIERASFWFDLMILLLTARAVFKRDGAF
jgi:lipopolysaccharide/colanic/teichoic acid biosynthesis glycosyltransferase